MPIRWPSFWLRARLPMLILTGVGGATLLVIANEMHQREQAVELGGAALLVALAAWHAANIAVRRRVAALLAATARLHGGDLSARSGIARDRGEIGELARRFDDMAATLERQQDEQARAERQLRLSEARKSAVLEASLDGILLLDGSGRVMECNAAARRMFGCSGERCVHHRLVELFPDVSAVTVQGRDAAGEVVATQGRRLDQSYFPAEISIAPIRDEAAEGLFAATVRDITERKLWEHSLETLSFVDELTGVYNRRGFLMFAAHQLKLAARAEQSVVLVGVDMDGLKAINDAFGHANGDRALVELAHALRASFRDTDVVGRIGGDEFVVLATEQQEAGADHALERFTMRLAGRNNDGDLPWNLSASVGWVRTRPNEPEDLGELLALVDERMYAQKRQRAGGTRRTSRRPLASPPMSPVPLAPRVLPDVRLANPPLPVDAARHRRYPQPDDVARVA